jgi:hypothetical protein
VIHGEWLQAFAAQAMFIFPAQFFSRPRSELHLKTPAAFEGRAAAKWISAGFTYAKRPSFRPDEFHQFA